MSDTANRHLSPLLGLSDPGLLKGLALIDGQWVDAPTHVEVRDPANASLIARVPRLGGNETQTAIEVAQRAWPAWRDKTAKARAAILLRWHELLLAHSEDLARLMTLEQGKPLAESRGEVAYGASFVEWFAQQARRVYGQTIPATDPDKRVWVLKQAVGVCAAITPWNFPIAMITRKVAPALAAGCTVIVKPAEATPLSALAVAELAQRAGMPAGVLNVLTSDAAGSVEIGQVLCASPTVRHLSFTGSTEVGRLLMAQCAPSVKRLSLELGGNAPFIVFDDADLDAAVEGALQSKYRNAGQTCVCANRLLVQRGVHDAFVDKLCARVRQLKIGHGLDDGVSQGPLIDEQALHKVQVLVEDALQHGAHLACGGQALRPVGSQGILSGAFFEPTVLTRANANMRLARQEIFGPVAPVFQFETEQEAIALANDTEFGLASYFYSRDVGRIHRVSEALEHGMVGVNTGLISTCEAPFGGVKQSGLGREGGQEGIDDYLEHKYVCLGGVNA